MKKTDWYERTQKPIRKGLYECCAVPDKTISQMDYWNGKKWCDGVRHDIIWDKTEQNTYKWRGLKTNAD